MLHDWCSVVHLGSWVLSKTLRISFSNGDTQKKACHLIVKFSITRFKRRVISFLSVFLLSLGIFLDFFLFPFHWSFSNAFLCNGILNFKRVSARQSVFDRSSLQLGWGARWEVSLRWWVCSVTGCGEWTRGLRAGVTRGLGGQECGGAWNRSGRLVW